MDELDLRRWSGSSEPALVVEDRSVSFGEVLAIGAPRVDGSRPGPIDFVATANLSTVALALSAITLGRAIVPLHPRSPVSEREALVARVAKHPPRADALAILATSGSTGEPKLVELSRSAFIASARSSRVNIPLERGDRWLLAMTFAHAGGLSILTRCLEAGATVVVEPRFDASRTLRAIETHGVSVLSVVPTMLALLLDQDGGRILSRTKAVLVGGAACPRELLERAWAEGAPALTTYGLTETCSQVTTQPLDRASMRSSADSGLPLDGTIVSVVDPSGVLLAAGKIGRISIDGPTLMTGYLGAPPRRGPLATEDLGSLDALGRLRVHGRADHMIVTGGENVHPLEVEDDLRKLPGVARALVAGVDDARWGKIVGALVVLEEGASLSAIEEATKARMPAHRRPRLFVAVESLPENAIGKLDRRAAAATLSREKTSSARDRE